MVRFEVSILIDKPVGMVDQALLRAENSPFWMTDLEKFEVVEGAPGEVGSVGNLHYVQNGRKFILKDTLVYCEKGRQYVSEVSGEAIFAQIETTLKSKGSGTELRLKWSGRGRVWFFKLLLPLIRRQMVRQTRKELETFKELLETRGVDFSKVPVEETSTSVST